jgi:hypothetical protein
LQPENESKQLPGQQQNPVRGRGSGNPEIRERAENGPEAPYALAILPLLMQLVHTRIRFGAPFTSALTACRFTFQRRRVTLWACEMLLPNCGPFPQTSHTCAIALLPILDCFVLPQFPSAQISIAKCRSFDLSVATATSAQDDGIDLRAMRHVRAFERTTGSLPKL